MTNPVDLDPKEYVATLGLLKTIDFLQGVPDENLKGALFILQKQNFGKNKTIMFQGEIANRMFIIREGSVVIKTRNKGASLELAELKAPMYFGEISLLRPKSATATVTAGEGGANLLILTYDAMSFLSKKVPDIKTRIQKVIDQRLDLKEKAKQADDAN